MQNSISDLIKGYVAGLTSRVLSPYFARVTQGGGIYEVPQCVESALNSQNVLNNASFILIPSGYKGGTLYSELPINGNGDLTWTRGSDAFRTNASGLIQRVPWNLLSWSEDLTNASWSKINTTITGDNTLAPNGTLTADLVSFSTSSGYVLKSQSVAPATQYTFSAYFKNNTFASGETIKFQLSDGVIAPAIATINVVAKTATYTTNPSAWTNLSGTIEQLPNDWFRVSVTATSVNGGTGWIEIATNGFTKSCFVWGIQLVTSSTAQTYLPTTDRLNFPRLSYMYGSCPALLLEPQRTNLLPNQLSYNTATGVAYSTSVTDSPVIGLNSTRITKNEASGTLRYGNQICSSSALAGSITYTISAYFKYDGYAVTTTMEYNNSLQWGGTSWNQIINIASTGVTLGSSSSCTGSVQNVGNGWYRVSVTITTGASISGGTPVSYLMQVASTLSTGQGFLQAAPQFEVGAYSTTPILTSGASATRIADSFSRNNIYTNGLISASGGTWFVELRNNEAYTRDASTVGLFLGSDSAGTTNSLVLRAASGSSRMSIAKYVGGAFTQIYLTTTTTAKIAIKWNGSTADVFVNGTKEVSATAFTATALEFLAHATTGDVPKFIQQMALFNSPLTDTQCQTLTT